MVTRLGSHPRGFLIARRGAKSKQNTCSLPSGQESGGSATTVSVSFFSKSIGVAALAEEASRGTKFSVSKYAVLLSISPIPGGSQIVTVKAEEGAAGGNPPRRQARGRLLSDRPTSCFLPGIFG
jgi:hypothetical protein